MCRPYRSVWQRRRRDARRVAEGCMITFATSGRTFLRCKGTTKIAKDYGEGMEK